MKTLLLKTLIVSSLVMALGAANAAHDPVLEKKMRECFEKHGQLMEKPAVRNMYDCYRVHGYLMK